MTKTASPDTIHAGDTVTYTIVVTNTGDVSLMVSVTDDLLGTIASNVLLDAAASATYIVTDNPTQDVTNTVTATGVFALIGDVEPPLALEWCSP